jgi:hypothetical protein
MGELEYFLRLRPAAYGDVTRTEGRSLSRT